MHFEYVNFEGCDPWDEIAECKNLEIFKMAFCNNIYWEMAKPVIRAKFGKLKKVVVWEVDCKELVEWANKFNSKKHEVVNDEEHERRTIKSKRAIC